MYILAIIGIYKIPGAVTLLVPGFLRLKEWAYAGIIFELSGAAASHAACGNWGELIAPLSLLCLAIGRSPIGFAKFSRVYHTGRQVPSYQPNIRRPAR